MSPSTDRMARSPLPMNAGLPSGWAAGPVPAEHAVRGIHSVALTPTDTAATAELLTAGLGLQPLGDEPGRQRFATGAGRSG